MELTDKQKAKLKEHAKLHKGGMRSKHMRNMKKFMMEGDSFTVAHNKAKKAGGTAVRQRVKKSY